MIDGNLSKILNLNLRNKKSILQIKHYLNSENSINIRFQSFQFYYSLKIKISTNYMSGDKKFHNSSLSFYQNQKSLIEVSNRVKLGFDNFPRLSKIIKQNTIELFQKFTAENKAGQKALLSEDSDAYMNALFQIVKVLNSNRELMEFVLPTIDAILIEQPKVLREIVNDIIQTNNTGILTQLKCILSIQNHEAPSYQAAARIVCIIMGELPRRQNFFVDQKNFILELLNLRKQVRKQRVSDFCLLSSLIHLIKHESLASVFMNNGGNQLIADSLKNGGNETQTIYYTLLNIWLLSFVPEAVEKFLAVEKFGILKSICEILQKLSREKLIRVAYLIFKNVQHNTVCLQLLNDNRLLKISDTLLKGNIKDEELIESIKNMATVLQDNMKVLSSFEKYARELNSENLQWSTVHTQRFWRDNALKFEQNDFQLIKKLRGMLNSRDSENCSIACYDIGQFCRFYPRGRAIVESLQLKQLIMQRARYSEDKKVREQALLALQKIMIQNWQNI